jgi:hypothetical protein
MSEKSNIEHISMGRVDIAGGGIHVLKPEGHQKWGAIALYAVLFLLSTLLLFLPSLAFASVYGLILSGCGCLYYYVKMVLASPELRLNSAGFSFKTFGREKQYCWADIDGPFDVYGGGRTRFPFVGFLLKGAKRVKKDRQNSYSDKLPGSFGMDSRALVNILNAYWHTAVGVK